jgi:anthranilate phosphoribosyltransferase
MVLQKLGSRHVLVVHAEDGLDEISITSPTLVAELKDGKIETYTVTPEQFGFKRATLKQITVDTVAASLKMMLAVLNGEPGPARDIVALNAGAAIYAANLVDSLEAGVAKAQAVIADGSARRKLDELVELSRRG